MSSAAAEIDAAAAGEASCAAAAAVSAGSAPPAPLPVLYSYWRSSSSYRVRIALHLKGVRFETRATHLVAGAQLEEAFAGAVNPMREVPALVVPLSAAGGDAAAAAAAAAAFSAAAGASVTLTQSPAILEWLEEAFPLPALLPPRSSPLLRAKVRELCAVVACDTQPLQNLRVLKHVASLLAEREPAEREAQRQAWARRYIGAGLEALERLLAASAGRFCVGDEVTLADLHLVPQVYNAARFKLDMAPFPTVARVVANCMQLEAFQRAQPSAQPDAEAE
jgi:maleylacetoacetate isomerase